jgi:dipeptide/tripeptide permease
MYHAVHPGLRATSYAIAVLVQNLIGSFTAPIVLGRISDLTNIKSAMSILPFSLLLGALLFLIGSRYYMTDMEKVTYVQLEAE